MTTQKFTEYLITTFEKGGEDVTTSHATLEEVRKLVDELKRKKAVFDVYGVDEDDDCVELEF